MIANSVNIINDLPEHQNKIINIINDLPAHRAKIINMLDFNSEKLSVITNNNNYLTIIFTNEHQKLLYEEIFKKK